MLRYLGPKLRKLERFNMHTFPGFCTKYCFFKDNNKFNRIIVSIYLLELLEKQKLKLAFSLSEKFIKKYVQYLSKYNYKRYTLSTLLNRRLDSILFNLGFCVSLQQARLLINHGYFLVNFRIIRQPSYIIRKGDFITLLNKSYYIYNICKRNLFNKYYKVFDNYNIKVSFCLNTLSCLILSNLDFSNSFSVSYNDYYVHHFYKI